MYSKYIKYAAVILPYVIIIIGYFLIRDLQSKNDRLFANQESLLTGINNLTLTHNELKDYLEVKQPLLLKAMSDSLKMNIRPGNITKYNETTVVYKDTTLIEMPMIYFDGTYPFEYKDSCWGVKGYFDINESKIAFSERSSEASIVTVDYIKREKVMKWFFGGIRLGKKKAGVYIDSKCGDAQRMEIDVQ